MLMRLVVFCCAALVACSTTFADPPPTRDITLRVFNGSTTTMSNIRVNGGFDKAFSTVTSLDHGELSAVITVKSVGRPLSIVVDALTPAKRTLSATVALLTEAQLASPTDPVILTLSVEGSPAHLVAELSQPVED